MFDDNTRRSLARRFHHVPACVIFDRRSRVVCFLFVQRRFPLDVLERGIADGLVVDHGHRHFRLDEDSTLLGGH